MDAGAATEPDLGPHLDEFLLARIAEDERMAQDAASASGAGHWSEDDAKAHGAAPGGAARLVARFGPERVLAECAAKRHVVLACRETRPDLSFLGSRPAGMPDFLLSPGNDHQLAAFLLAELAVPYAGHHDYRPRWRP